MKFPPFFYVRKFWEAVSLVLAGVLGLLVVFKVLPTEYAVSAGTLLAWILAILNFFDIDPEFRVLKAKSKKSRK